MRRLGAFIVAAGLAVAPADGAAGPADKPDLWAETQWSAPRTRLGVLVTALTPELREHFGAARDRGVLVARVEPRSAADVAGIRVGDVIVDVKGHAVDDASDVTAALARTGKGDTVAVQVIRNKQPLTLQARVNESLALMEKWWPSWWTEWLRRLEKPEQAAAQTARN